MHKVYMMLDLARTENEVARPLGPNPFQTIAASSGIINVFEKSHGRSTGDTVRFRGPIYTTSLLDAFTKPKSVLMVLQDLTLQKLQVILLQLVKEIQVVILQTQQISITLL